MCGIIGYSSLNPIPEHRQWIKELLIESNIRGTHAYGISYIDSDQLRTARFFKLSEILIYIDKIKWPKKLILHNRYDTSGDYHVLTNNQPLQIINCALAFNGIISMSTKKENEQKYQLTLKTENDGEIFLRKLFQGQDMKDFIDNENISFAGLILQNELKALRNKKRPLYMIDYKNTRLFASTSDIFKRALNVESVLIPELTWIN